jgi:lipoprotein-anchoring transpeptidase ErfK/SrfK
LLFGLWLNPGVASRSKPKYQLPRKRRNKSGVIRWLFVLAIVAVAAWFWWRHEHPAKPARVVTPAPAKSKARQWSGAAEAAGGFPHAARNVFEAQIALARRGISPGSIDAVPGSQTRKAISVFQEMENLPQTGVLDAETGARLTLDSPPLTTCVVTTNDLAGLQPLGKTWLAKSQQSSLAYETELELVAEKGHAHPELIRQLNPNVSWTNLTAGTAVKIPDVNYPAPTNKAAFAVIHLGDKFLEAFDEESNLLVHFPCSIAAHVEKRPVGELHVIVVAPNPNYTFDPELFPESPEAQQSNQTLVIPPGPNNPVGVAWIGLDKPGYGIHGAPNPEQIGRTESHGCFRLANWDAEYLSHLVWVGMPVFVEP